MSSLQIKARQRSSKNHFDKVQGRNLEKVASVPRDPCRIASPTRSVNCEAFAPSNDAVVATNSETEFDASSQVPLSKDVEPVIKETKKEGQRERNRIDQANYCKRQREYATRTGNFQVPSSMNTEQAATTKLTAESCGYETPVSRRADLYETRNSEPLKSVGTESEESKNKRRREQRRINQANHRKRKRLNELHLKREIEVLESKIKQLEAAKFELNPHKKQNKFVQAIGDFYYALRTEAQQDQSADVKVYQRMYGCLPGLPSLLDLQREEFSSIESLKLHWTWYRQQFRVFKLSLKSFDILKAGEHVIIKFCGELQLDVYSDAEHRSGKRFGYGTIVCSVLQQFEFNGEELETRITSEVDLVGGVAGSHGAFNPGRTVAALRCLSEGFCLTKHD